MSEQTDENLRFLLSQIAATQTLLLAAIRQLDRANSGVQQAIFDEADMVLEAAAMGLADKGSDSTHITAKAMLILEQLRKTPSPPAQKRDVS